MFDDLFDAVDDILLEELDEAEEVWYTGVASELMCEFGFGDDDGFCIKSKYNCHIEGCPYASPND